MASNAENVSIWWHHHENVSRVQSFLWCTACIHTDRVLERISQMGYELIIGISFFFSNCSHFYPNDPISSQFCTAVVACANLWHDLILRSLNTLSMFYASVYKPCHGDVSKWKHFPRYWPFVRGIHRSPVNSPHKGQWRGALMFSSICAWTNSWTNNREAGDLRRHRSHCDAIVMPRNIVMYSDLVCLYRDGSVLGIYFMITSPALQIVKKNKQKDGKIDDMSLLESIAITKLIQRKPGMFDRQ